MSIYPCECNCCQRSKFEGMSPLGQFKMENFIFSGSNKDVSIHTLGIENVNLKKELSELKELVEQAINWKLIVPTGSENDWDIYCDDWLIRAEKAVGK